MRLVTACMLISSTTSLVANGFQATSPLSVRTSRVSTSSKSVATAPMSATTSSSMSYDEVNKLAFRGLQSECKQLGLSAVGTTAALRGRLLEHFGLAKEVALEKGAAPAVTPEEIEVRRNDFTIALQTYYVMLNINLTLIQLIAYSGALRYRWHHILR